MPKNPEVPGNSLASQALFDKEISKAGEALYHIASFVSKSRKEGCSDMALRLRAPSMEGGEWLAVLTVKSSDGAVVSFTSGESLPGTLRSVSGRLRNGSMKWREDQYG